MVNGACPHDCPDTCAFRVTVEDGRAGEAADRLGVHRHTMRHRLRRIEAATGRDLTSARDRLELWLALKAREVAERRER